MPAYVIIFREEPLQKPEELEEYRRKAAQNPRDPKLKPLSFYKEITALEGEAPDAVILIEFPTLEDAKGWYHSPQYQAALPHRLAAAKHRAVIVEG